MSTLIEIEDAADSLSSEDKAALLRFLAMRLREERSLRAPRIYSDDEVTSMLVEVGADIATPDLNEFAGALRLTEDPLIEQRRMREDWP